jgi:CRP-like cAMP-binding protein
MARLDLSVVRDLPLFREMADEDLRAIVQTAQTRRLARKVCVFRQGQPAKEFFVLLSGHLKVVQTAPSGRQTIVRIVEPGDVYGVAVTIGRPDYPGTAIAMEESLTLVWPSSEWSRLVARAPQLAVNALHTVGQRLQEAHARIQEFSTEEAERRIAHVLLRLFDVRDSRNLETLKKEFPITRQDVAEMTGTTVYTVSRILSFWESQGLIAGGREKIGIRDAERLRLIAERPAQD